MNLHSQRKIAWYFTFIFILLYYTALFIAQTPLELAVYTSIFHFLAPFISSIMLLQAALKKRDISRLFYILLFFATTSYLFSEVVYNYYELYLKVEVPAPGWPDVYYLLTVTFFILAISTKIKHNFKKITTLAVAFDTLLFLTTLSSVYIIYLIKPTISLYLETSLVTLLVYSAFPILDLGLILTTVLAIFIGEETFRYRNSVIYVTGFCIYLVADISA